MLRGGASMLLKPRALHTKACMAAASLSGLTACTSCWFSALVKLNAQRDSRVRTAECSFRHT